MNQVLNEEATLSDEYYQQEVRKMLAEINVNNEKMRRDQEEINWLKQQSAATRQRIRENLERIEKILK